MVTFKQILCPTDLSGASARPLAHAVAIARWYRARLTVLHVVPTFDPVEVQSPRLGEPVQFVYPVPRETVLAELRRAVDAAGGDARQTTVVAEAGDPVRTIVDQAVGIPADLLVMGTHGRSGFDRLVLGSVAEKTLRKAPCPVLTVPPHAPITAPAEVVFRRIVCAMDFSPSSLQALGFALDLAQQSRGVVTVLHVVEWLAEEEPRTHPSISAAEYRTHLSADAQVRMRPLISETEGPRCEFEHVVVFGRAHREIVQAAQAKEADLIVMGAQGRGGVGLRLFGSTAQQVVRTATCPVLTVHG